MSDDYTNNDVPSDAAGNEAQSRLAELQGLRAQHRHLDSNILALQQTGVTDMLKIARMKKLKLSLKDKIREIEDSLTPNIIA